MFFKPSQKLPYYQNYDYNNPQTPYPQGNQYYPIQHRRNYSLDSISHPYGNMQTKPVTYSATVDPLSSPRMHYQPTPPHSMPQQPQIPKAIQRPIQHHIPPYNPFPQSYGNSPVPAHMLSPQRKNSFRMPQAISLGVAFGLFTLGFLSFLF